MEKCPFPSVWWSFPHDSHCYKLSPLQIAGWVPLVLPSLPSLFIYSLPEVLPLTHSLELGVPSPLCYMSFFFQLLVYYSVCFFPLGRGQSVQGAMLIWSRVVCGSTKSCLFAHLLVCFSQAG
jgi:hypothetical protein